MSTKRRKRHTPEQIVRKLRDADAMLRARISSRTWGQFENSQFVDRHSSTKRLPSPASCLSITSTQSWGDGTFGEVQVPEMFSTPCSNRRPDTGSK